MWYLGLIYLMAAELVVAAPWHGAEPRWQRTGHKNPTGTALLLGPAPNSCWWALFPVQSHTHTGELAWSGLRTIWKSMGNDNVCTVHRAIFFLYFFKFIAKTTKPNVASGRQAGSLPCRGLAIKICRKPSLKPPAWCKPPGLWSRSPCREHSTGPGQPAPTEATSIQLAPSKTTQCFKSS